MKAGEKTWEGQIIGNRIIGIIYGRGPNDVNLSEWGISGEIKNKDLFHLDELIFERIKE